MIDPRILRFAVVGAVASAIHVGVGLGLVRAGLAPLQANGVAFLAALGASYLGNSLWTFSVPVARLGAFVRFVVLSLAAFAANQAIVWGLGGIGWSYAASLAVVLVTVPPLTFLAARSWALARTPG